MSLKIPSYSLYRTNKNHSPKEPPPAHKSLFTFLIFFLCFPLLFSLLPLLFSLLPLVFLYFFLFFFSFPLDKANLLCYYIVTKRKGEQNNEHRNNEHKQSHNPIKVFRVPNEGIWPFCSAIYSRTLRLYFCIRAFCIFYNSQLGKDIRSGKQVYWL